MTGAFKIEIDTAISESKVVADQDLRGRAFEVILAHLLERSVILKSSQASKGASSKLTGKTKESTPNTLQGRIQALKDDDFFKSQRTLGDVRGELRTKGWHYPATSISGPLQHLVRLRELRREQINDGKKKVWMYSNF